MHWTFNIKFTSHVYNRTDGCNTHFGSMRKVLTLPIKYSIQCNKTSLRRKIVRLICNSILLGGVTSPQSLVQNHFYPVNIWVFIVVSVIFVKYWIHCKRLGFWIVCFVRIHISKSMCVKDFDDVFFWVWCKSFFHIYHSTSQFSYTTIIEMKNNFSSKKNFEEK